MDDGVFKRSVHLLTKAARIKYTPPDWPRESGRRIHCCEAQQCDTASTMQHVHLNPVLGTCSRPKVKVDRTFMLMFLLLYTEYVHGVTSTSYYYY